MRRDTRQARASDNLSNTHAGPRHTPYKGETVYMEPTSFPGQRGGPFVAQFTCAEARGLNLRIGTLVMRQGELDARPPIPLNGCPHKAPIMVLAPLRRGSLFLPVPYH